MNVHNADIPDGGSIEICSCVLSRYVPKHVLVRGLATAWDLGEAFIGSRVLRFEETEVEVEDVVLTRALER